MSCSRSCNFCETADNLLTVTMHLQDALSRFHRPVHVASASTRTLAFHKSQNCWAVRAQNNHCKVSICTICSIGLSLRCSGKLHQPTPSAWIHQLQQTMFCFLEDAHTGCHVFSKPLTQNEIPEQLRRSLTSQAHSAWVMTTTDLRNTRNTRNIKSATNMLHARFPTKYLSKRFMLISSRVAAVPT